jgi:hypothetical protein
MQAEELIQSLIEQVRQIINQAEGLKNYEQAALSWREDPTSWNVLECLEHMNLYGDFYLPQMERKIKASSHQPDVEFRSGLLGNYFANSMLPKEKLNKMQTFKDKNPINSQLDMKVIDTFLGQQFQLLEVLNLSRKVSLNKVKIETSISSMIKLRLGDAFRFYVNHMIRHMKQIERIEKGMGSI